MKNPPQRLREGLDGPPRLIRAFNELREAHIAAKIRRGRGVLVRETSGGTNLTVTQQAAAGGGDGVLTWRGEWKSTIDDYVRNDLVIRGSNNYSSRTWNSAASILGDGGLAGLYIAVQDEVPVNTPPLELSTSSTPEFPVYWETFARYATQIFALRQPGYTSKIYLEASAPDAPSQAASVSIRLVDCNGKTLSIREINVCVAGDPNYKMMVLGSAPYL